MRQVDDPADPGRARRGHRGRGLHRRHAGHRPPAEGTGRRDGVPELRALSAHDRRTEPRVRPAPPQDAEGRAEAARRRRRDDPGPRSPDAAQAGRALRWTAATGGDGSRDGAGTAGVPDGRALVEPGRQAPRADARAALAPPRTPRHHDDLRHARSGRGHDVGPARRRAEGRHPPAGRHAAEPVHASREPVRRRVHRLAAHEPRRGTGVGGSRVVRGIRHRASSGSRLARDTQGRT